MENYKLGHIYKVRKNWRNYINFSSKKKDYYCVVLPDIGYFNGINYGLVTYIPGMFFRPLNKNASCELDTRLTHVGAFDKFGDLLYNQKNLIISEGYETLTLFSNIIWV